MNFGTSNAETDSLDFAVRLLAVGVSANCARTAAQSTARAVIEPGTSTPSGLIQSRHSGLDTARCDTANYYALPANAGSAQPIAHCGVLPVEFDNRCDVAWPPGLGKRAETFPKKGSIPSHGANSMTTARTVAPNHGGRANTRGRAVVANSFPAALHSRVGLCAAKCSASLFGDA